MQYPIYKIEFLRSLKLIQDEEGEERHLVSKNLIDGFVLDVSSGLATIICESSNV